MVWTNAGQGIRRNRPSFVTPALRCGHIPGAPRLACTSGPYTPRVDIPPPPPPPPPPSPDDVPPPGPPSYDKNPYQQDNPYAQQPTQAAMPGTGVPQQPGYPGAPAGGYGYPGAQGPQPGYPGAQQTGYPGAPVGGYGYPGPVGMPQYPGQPGWYGQPQQQPSTNGLSIAALILGILPCPPILGLIFGLIGLRQTKRRGQRGRGMAITGIVGSTVWVALLAVLITLGIMNTGNTDVADLKAGQCFNLVHEKLSDFGNDKVHSGTVDVVDCEKEHDAEVIATFEIQSAHDDTYPGVQAVGREAGNTCHTYLRPYLGVSTAPANTEEISYIPSYDNWKDHQRSVVCFLGGRDGKLTGTLKNGGGTSDSGGGSDDTSDDSDGGVGV